MTGLRHTWNCLQGIGAGRVGWIAAEPPANAGAIASAEQRLRRPLPPALVAWLRTSRTWGWVDQHDTVIFLPPEEIVEQTQRPRNTDLVLEVEEAVTPRVAPLVYANTRTTFARTDYLFYQIDDAPCPGGRPGQIVSIDFEAGLIDVVAESIDAFVAHGLACLKAQLQDDATAMQLAIPAIDDATLPPRVAVASKPAKPARVPKPSHPIGVAQVAYDAWLATTLPEGTKRFRKGATVKSIRQFLSAEGHSLPEELFSSFEAFNGQAAERTPLLPPPIVDCAGLVWLSCDGATRAHSNQEGAIHLFGRGEPLHAPGPPGIKNGFWRKKWWPVARTSLEESRYSCVLFVDHDPAPDGTHGQVVLDYLRVRDGRFVDGRRYLVAPTLTAYFEQLARQAREGKLRYVPREGVTCDR